MNLTPEEFNSLTKEGNLIPLYEEIMGDICTPVGAFIRLKKRPAFLLESVVGGEKWARYSFIGFDPQITVKYQKAKTYVTYTDSPKDDYCTDLEPLSVMKEILSTFRPVPVEGLPRFYGGFVGYIGYDIVRLFERLPDLKRPAFKSADLFMMIPRALLIFDNLRQTIKVLCNVCTNGRDPLEAYKEGVGVIEEIIGTLKRGRLKALKGERLGIIDSSSVLTSNFTKEGFKDAVLKAKEYIFSGDIVQVVLSQRFEKTIEDRPFDIYRALRIINPSPYMYYLDTGKETLVGSSPEILVRLEDGHITVRPIAGTRRRGLTHEEDLALAEELINDPKERAEHIMLVDLGRNDIGRVAKIGSVRVTDLMTIERYSHVMHLVSNVEGILKEGLDAFDVFRATFPAGTVSGAPKIRAMEIIEELEPTRRGPYAGAVGYFGYSGNMDTCITIRTLVIKGKKVYIQAGAGIVADSDPESEYLETVNKAKAMLRATEFFDGVR
jgi:anthranilate synthase component 1